jgi:thiol-disulfide isomerase/thioredoxin
MIVAVVVLTLLCLVNVLLTLGLARRIREEPPAVMLPPGSRVDTALEPPTLIGFFSPGCGPCNERLPEFVARARRAPAGRTVAVVVGDGEHADDMVATLTAVTSTVVEPRGGTLATTFGVKGFPAFALVGDGGRIEASGTDLASIPHLAAA